MKRTLWHFLLSSVLGLAAYLVLTLTVIAFAGGFKNPDGTVISPVALTLVFIATQLVFCLCLVYFHKLRGGILEKEIWADYKDTTYVSLRDDLKRLFPRERLLLIILGVTTLICFVLNMIDKLLPIRLLSTATMPFISLFLFDTLIPVPFVGYLISYLLNVSLYLALLLLTRRKKYAYWMDTTPRH